MSHENAEGNHAEAKSAEANGAEANSAEANGAAANGAEANGAGDTADQNGEEKGEEKGDLARVDSASMIIESLRGTREPSIPYTYEPSESVPQARADLGEYLGEYLTAMPCEGP